MNIHYITPVEPLWLSLFARNETPVVLLSTWQKDCQTKHFLQKYCMPIGFLKSPKKTSPFFDSIREFLIFQTDDIS